MLWDDGEKMLDKTFSIHLFEFNHSANNSNFYRVSLDSNVSEGYFQDHLELNFTWETATIFNLLVEVNNETLLSGQNVKIMKGISGSGISSPSSPFTLNLSPWEWSQKEWNIVGAIVLSSLVGLLIGYRVAKRYRRMAGVREVK
jgi:hypothetical protein